LAELPESDKPTAFHQIDFDVPLYNVWKQQEKTADGVSASFASSDYWYCCSCLIVANAVSSGVMPFTTDSARERE
jgi:hypothetical protein